MKAWRKAHSCNKQTSLANSRVEDMSLFFQGATHGRVAPARSTLSQRDWSFGESARAQPRPSFVQTRGGSSKDFMPMFELRKLM